LLYTSANRAKIVLPTVSLVKPMARSFSPVLSEGGEVRQRELVQNHPHDGIRRRRFRPHGFRPDYLLSDPAEACAVVASHTGVASGKEVGLV
jgi:hypothetical protein